MADAVTIDIAREPNLHRWAHPLVLPWLLLTPPLALGAYLAACGCLGELRWLGVLILALAAAVAAIYAGMLAVLFALGLSCLKKPVQSKPRASGVSKIHVDVLELGSFIESVPSGGAIGMTEAPGRKRALEDDLKELCYLEFDLLVTLIEEHENLKFGFHVQEMTAAVNRAGLQWLRVAIRDKWIPSDSAAFLRVAEATARAVAEGKRVCVHCNGGKGRTGTLVACVLLALRAPGCESVGGATAVMRRCRPGMLKNPLQQLYVRWLRQAIAPVEGLKS